MLKNGDDPDLDWCGVQPLHLAVEQGDVDMAAVLLNWKAKPDRGKRLAEALAAKEGHRLQSKAKAILKFMGDPKACTEHVEGVVDVKIQAANARDFRMGCLVGVAGLGMCALYWFVFRPIQTQGEL